MFKNKLALFYRASTPKAMLQKNISDSLIAEEYLATLGEWKLRKLTKPYVKEHVHKYKYRKLKTFILHLPKETP